MLSGAKFYKGLMQECSALLTYLFVCMHLAVSID